MISTIVQYDKPRQPVPASHSIAIHMEPDQAERIMRIVLDTQASSPDMSVEDAAVCLATACQIKRQLPKGLSQ